MCLHNLLIQPSYLQLRFRSALVSNTGLGLGLMDFIHFLAIEDSYDVLRHHEFSVELTELLNLRYEIVFCLRYLCFLCLLRVFGKVGYYLNL